MRVNFLTRRFSQFGAVRKAVLEERNFKKAFKELRLSRQYLESTPASDQIGRLVDLMPELKTATDGDEQQKSYSEVLGDMIEGKRETTSYCWRVIGLKDMGADDMLVLSQRDFNSIAKKKNQPTMDCWQRLLCENLSAVPVGYFKSVLDVCSFKTEHQQRLKSLVLERVKANPRLMRGSYSLLFELFPKQSGWISSCQLEALQKGHLSKEQFVHNFSKASAITDGDRRVLQKLISQGDLGEAWKGILIMGMRHRFFYSESNKKEVFQFLDAHPHMTMAALVFFLKSDITDDVTEWIKLRQRISASPESASMLKTILQLADFSRFSQEVRAEVLELLWDVVGKSLQGKGTQKATATAQRLGMFMKIHSDKLARLGIQTVPYNKACDKFTRRTFFPILQASEVAERKQAGRTPERHREILQSQRASGSLEYLLAAKHICLARSITESESRGVADYIVKNLNQLELSSIIVAKQLYPYLKYHLPNNFNQVLQAKVSVELPTADLTTRNRADLLLAFGLKVFDAHTLLEFQWKLSDGVAHLPYKVLCLLLAKFNEAQLGCYPLVDAIQARVFKNMEAGRLELGAARLINQLASHTLNKDALLGCLVGYLRRHPTEGEQGDEMIGAALSLMQSTEQDVAVDLIQPGQNPSQHSRIYLVLAGKQAPTAADIIFINSNYPTLGEANIHVQQHLKGNFKQYPLRDILRIAYKVPMDLPLSIETTLKPQNVREYISILLLVQNSTDPNKHIRLQRFCQNTFALLEAPLPSCRQYDDLIENWGVLPKQGRDFLEKVLIRFEASRPDRLLRYLLENEGYWSQRFIEFNTKHMVNTLH